MKVPIEICEAIIDEYAQAVEDLFDPLDVRPSTNFPFYRARASLLACALTCKAWLPRSIIALYRSIHLYSRDQALNLTRALIRLSRTLDIQVNVLSLNNHLHRRMDPPSNTFYFAPYCFASRRVDTGRLRTIDLIGDFGPNSEIGPNTPDIFLRSLTALRSIQTLNLLQVSFGTIQHFIRLITTLQSLRNVTLRDGRVKNLIPLHPRHLTRRARPTLRSLHFFHVSESFLSGLQSWIAVDPLFVFSLEHFGVYDDTDHHLTLGLFPLIETILSGSAKSLRTLILQFKHRPISMQLRLQSNTSLQSLELDGLSLSTVISVLAPLSSSHRSLSHIALTVRQTSDSQDLTEFTTILLSQQFLLLPKAMRITIIIKEKSDSETQFPKHNEVLDCWKSLRKVYGDRLKMGYCQIFDTIWLEESGTQKGEISPDLTVTEINEVEQVHG